MTTDPIALTADLIRCETVSPAEGGALQLLEARLAAAGFTCTRVDRNGTPNLFARWGTRGPGPCFGFNGHTDVVPVGNRDDWSFDPFCGELRDGWLLGRGATDMKSGVAAFVAAAIDFVTETAPEGAIALAITGDEEGEATDGTIALLDWMERQGERMDHCLVGEPTSPEELGDMMKIGRRGSMTAYVTAEGVQGHSAYPHRANNPVPALARLVALWSNHVLDDGTEHFDASTLAVTGFETGNEANNVIPAKARAMANIRFNDAHDSASLCRWLEDTAAAETARSGVKFHFDYQISGESFLTPPGPLSDLVADAVEAETGRRPALSTSGGTSDARFVKDHCPVVEFGLVGKTMHQVDERVEAAQITALKAIYARILAQYFSGAIGAD
ncbi:succinyl-diaminopimelate desuccinylase [Oceanomicrobium pacificus]|uniref:Succinyl-diaminopimelate desuccinylase n=1 Tax=Oceanomicrobium pacificus TaxID=2692916 RepID=A0A6B0TYU5_9RHOB|nr:succinyl-diaminopimelate desuccinylase [Oceanomicrobium pacificus]MXU64071.1 succinyl-diaminopimelate desuccinylase [Oceanomicrobium pacificus]